MLAGIALAGPIADFYGEPEVRPLFAALSVGFFISALGTTQSALFIRDMEFRVFELRAIAATVVGAVAGITVALADFGAWAIVTQQLAEVVTSTILLWFLSPWRPSATFSVASLRRLGGFAGNVFGENVLYQAGRNLSGLLIGRFLGPASLGTFTLATNVILVPFSRIAGPLQQVFFPAFSRMSDDRERMADVWIRATRLVGAISIPALVGLVIVAPDFVQVVLGPRWSEVTPVIQILAWVGLIQSLQTLNGEVLLALDRSGWLLRFTMLWFVGSVGAFVLGVQWGVLGVATCYAVGDGADRARPHVHHDARARDLTLAVRPLARRRGAGDRDHGGHSACCACGPGCGGCPARRAAGAFGCAGRGRLSRLLPVACSRDHARDQGNDRESPERRRPASRPRRLSSSRSARRLCQNAGPTGVGVASRRSYHDSRAGDAAHHDAAIHDEERLRWISSSTPASCGGSGSSSCWDSSWRWRSRCCRWSA